MSQATDPPVNSTRFANSVPRRIAAAVVDEYQLPGFAGRRHHGNEFARHWQDVILLVVDGNYDGNFRAQIK